MRATTLILAALTTLVAADEWSYTGKPVPWSAGEVWTSPCTDYTFTYTVPSVSSSGGYSTTRNASPSTWTTVYSSGASTWTTIATAAPVSQGDSGSSGSPAKTTAGGGYGGSYPSAGSEADTPAPTTTVAASGVSGVPAGTYTGAANQKVIGAGVVAAAGLALLL